MVKLIDSRSIDPDRFINDDIAIASRLNELQEIEDSSNMLNSALFDKYFVLSEFEGYFEKLIRNISQLQQLPLNFWPVNGGRTTLVCGTLSQNNIFRVGNNWYPTCTSDYNFDITNVFVYWLCPINSSTGLVQIKSKRLIENTYLVRYNLRKHCISSWY